MLVVEDDAQVKMMIGAVLADFGYRVPEAVDAESALAILKSGESFDLLITDVGLPGITAANSPNWRGNCAHRAGFVCTGYAANAAVRAEFLDPGMHMISKPFSVQALATAVRDTLQPLA